MSREPSTKPAEKELVDRTLDDHAECMQLVGTLERSLEGHMDAAWLDRLREVLPRLLDRMRCHFSEESQDPLYRELPLKQPHLADRLERLEGEHAEIVKAAEAAIARIDKLADPEPYELHEVNAQVQYLVAKIRRHEAEENEIVISVYWDTLGVGD